VEVGAADDEVEVDVDEVEVVVESEVVTGASRVVDVEDVVEGTSIEEVLLSVELVEVELVEDVAVGTSDEVVVVDEVEDTLVDVVVVLDDEVEVEVEVAGTDKVVPPGRITLAVDPTEIVVVAMLEVVTTFELVVEVMPTVLVIVVLFGHNLVRGLFMLKIMRIPPMTQDTSLTMAPGDGLAVTAGMTAAVTVGGCRMIVKVQSTNEGSHIFISDQD